MVILRVADELLSERSGAELNLVIKAVKLQQRHKRTLKFRGAVLEQCGAVLSWAGSKREAVLACLDAVASQQKASR